MENKVNDDSQKLHELHTAFGIFIKEWDDVKHNGFRLCATRGAEMENLKKEVGWIRRTFVTIVLAAALTFSVGQIWGGGDARKTKDDGNAGVETGRHLFDIKPDGAAKGDQRHSEVLEQGS
jgi:hypothetical protein